jgi:preprotein translocase subunit SecD
MKTLADILRDADPVTCEAPPALLERRARRQALLKASHEQVELTWPRRTVLIAAAVSMAAIGVGVVRSRVALQAVASVRFEARLAEDKPGAGLREVVGANGQHIYLHPETVVTNSDITEAKLVQGDTPSVFSVSLTFTAAGAEQMRRATASHIGQTLAILIDGEVVMAPVIRAPITTSALITGSFARAVAERIVAGIIGR